MTTANAEWWHEMERRHHTDEEIEEILADVDGGLSIDQVTRRHNVSRATIYRWRKKVRVHNERDVKRLRHADEENARLRNLLADAAIKIHELQERLSRFE